MKNWQEEAAKSLDAKTEAAQRNLEYTVPVGTRRDRPQLIVLLTEIRSNYEKLIEEFPFSESIMYYRDHVVGLTDAIEELKVPAPATDADTF